MFFIWHCTKSLAKTHLLEPLSLLRVCAVSRPVNYCDISTVCVFYTRLFRNLYNEQFGWK